VRKKQKQNIYFSYFSKVIKRILISTRNDLNKVVIVGRSNNAEVSGQIPYLPEANKGSETEPPTLRRFWQFFFQNISIFKYTLAYIST